jgi:hypothetical protein
LLAGDYDALLFADIAQKTKNETFMHEKQEDTRVKHREKKLQEMEMAYWKWREIVGNCEEGIRVRPFAVWGSDMQLKRKETVLQWFFRAPFQIQRDRSKLGLRSQIRAQVCSSVILSDNTG